jgi:hypothetical protein
MVRLEQLIHKHQYAYAIALEKRWEDASRNQEPNSSQHTQSQSSHLSSNTSQQFIGY